MKFFISLLLSLVIIGKSFSQEANTEINPEYIIDYSDLLSVRFFGIVKSNEIKHVDKSDESANYRPNENFNLGFGFGYKWLGLNLAFNFPFINNDNARFGKTKQFDIQSNIFTRKFAANLNLQLYKGYYNSNADSYIPDFNTDEDAYPTRPDIRTVNVGGNVQYIFKHSTFSYRSVFTFNERQQKSAGSFLLGSYFNYFKMDADSSIIPTEIRSNFDLEEDFRGTRYINFGVDGGYAHTFVVDKKWFFSITGILAVGPELKLSPAIGNRESKNTSKISGGARFRFSLGRNSEKIYYGVSAVANTIGGQDGTAHLERNVNNFRIFIGKRFNIQK